MLQGETELHCECPHCGKSAYQTIRWLRENPAVVCEGCGKAMLSSEILAVNTRQVRKSDDAERRGTP